MTKTAPAARPWKSYKAGYSQGLHTLVTERTREIILGLAVYDAESGVRPKEGDTVRRLIADALLDLEAKKGSGFMDRLATAGRAELASRLATTKSGREQARLRAEADQARDDLRKGEIEA